MSDDRGVYAPPTSEYDGYDVSDEAEPRRGPLLLIVALGVVIAFGGIVWSAYHLGVREGGRDAPPRVLAENDGFKEAADDEGFQTPHQDITVFDRVSGESGDENVNVAESLEEPVLRQEAPAAADPPPATPRGDDRPTQIEDLVAEVIDETPDPLAQAPAPAVQTPASTLSVAGDFLVQVAAFRSRDEADAAWRALESRHSDLLSGHAQDVQTADLGDRGVYHRLRIAAFGDRSAAGVVCDQLKARGQDCIVVRR